MTQTNQPTDFIVNGTVPVLAEQVSTAPREKVIRVALAALHNLCYGRLDTLNAEMISCGLPKTLENLLDRKWYVRADRRADMPCRVCCHAACLVVVVLLAS